jgi:cysteine synthase A
MRGLPGPGLRPALRLPKRRFATNNGPMIDLTVQRDRLERAVRRARERNILIPTFAQMKDPGRIPAKVKGELAGIELWTVHPRNLFRINWKNEPVARGGGFGGVNYIEFPPALTGVEARIIALIGKWFPTGAHKVGAAFACLVPRLVTGQFDPTSQKAVWPSTGNYCRGGAYDSALLACDSIAILPEGMSRERFQWLAGIAGEVIRTPGSESNVKEIFDKCRELRQSGQDLMIFNQFEEPGNYLWHYEVTGHAMEEVLQRELAAADSYHGVALSTGSAGTIGCGDYLKSRFPGSRIAASEALQCPTLLANGFGAHRIEGIGDKHVPWIHNVKNSDVVVAIDDQAVVSLARLFNERAGRAYLAGLGVPEPLAARLDLLGFSGIANLLSCIKYAKYFELTRREVVLTVLTDSMELYGSRLEEMRAQKGEYGELEAAADHARYLAGAGTDHLLELSYQDRRRVHNLKYYTWVEQQGRTYDEVMAQWYDPNYWRAIQSQAPQIDALIEEFNRRVGL